MMMPNCVTPNCLLDHDFLLQEGTFKEFKLNNPFMKCYKALCYFFTELESLLILLIILILLIFEYLKK